VTLPGTVTRIAGSADLPGLLVLAAEYAAAEGHAFNRQRVAQALVPLCAADPAGAHGWVVVCTDAADAPHGYAVLTWGWSLEAGGLEALLDEVYTRHRGRGHGSALLRHCIEIARSAGAGAVTLETEAANDGARRLYRRHGFVAEESVWMRLDLRPRDTMR